jgi:SAM-dependent methyltransferase
MSGQDQTNRSAWSRPWALGWFTTSAGFCDAGEKAAFEHIAEGVRGRRILDIGVGGGRTVEMMRSLSTNYVGLDYMPEMVAAATRRFAGVDIRLGDARDLSQFPDGTFDLVTFSNAGIDAVAHEDRPRILSEARRVLGPAGLFWFSTLHKDGPSPRFRPWSPVLGKRGDALPTRAKAAVGWLRTMPQSIFNYFRSRHLWREGDGWSVGAMSAHNYGLVVHYTTLALQLTELERAGFRPDPEVFDDRDGRRLSRGEDLREVFSFNIVARR